MIEPMLIVALAIFIFAAICGLILFIIYAVNSRKEPGQAEISKLMQPGIKAIFDEEFNQDLNDKVICSRTNTICERSRCFQTKDGEFISVDLYDLQDDVPLLTGRML